MRIAIVLVVLLALGLITTISSCHSVPAGHRGVVTSFGAVEPVSLGEGMQWAAPWKIIIDSSTQQQANTLKTECFSSDLQTVVITYNQLSRKSPEGVSELYQKYQGDPILNLVTPRVSEALKQITATLPAQEIVRKREFIREKALEIAKKSVGTLVVLDDINILNIDLTKELEQAIESKMVQEQQSFAKKFELDKEKTNAEITIVKAKAEAEAVKITGAALEIAPMMIQLEAVKKWDGKAPQTLVIGSGGATPVIPIDAMKHPVSAEVKK